MKAYLVILGDKQVDQITPVLLQDHVDYLVKLKQQKILQIAGLFTDDEGAVMILVADSKDKVRTIIENDPFVLNGYYKNYLIKEFMQANEENQWLS